MAKLRNMFNAAVLALGITGSSYALPPETLKSLVTIQDATKVDKDHYFLGGTRKEPKVTLHFDYTPSKTGEFVTAPKRLPEGIEPETEARNIENLSSSTGNKPDIRVISFERLEEPNSYVFTFRPSDGKQVYLVEKLGVDIKLARVVASSPFAYDGLIVKPNGELVAEELEHKKEVSLEDLINNERILFNNSYTLTTDREGQIGFKNTPPSKDVSKQDAAKPTILQFKDLISSLGRLIEGSDTEKLHAYLANGMAKYAESYGFNVTSAVIPTNQELEARIRAQVSASNAKGSDVEDNVNKLLVKELLKQAPEGGFYFKTGNVPLYVSNQPASHYTKTETKKSKKKVIKTLKRFLGTGAGRLDEVIIQPNTTLYLNDDILNMFKTARLKQALGLSQNNPEESGKETRNVVGIGYEQSANGPRSLLFLFESKPEGNGSVKALEFNLGYNPQDLSASTIATAAANPNDPNGLTGARTLTTGSKGGLVAGVGGGLGYKNGRFLFKGTVGAEVEADFFASSLQDLLYFKNGQLATSGSSKETDSIRFTPYGKAKVSVGYEYGSAGLEGFVGTRFNLDGVNPTFGGVFKYNFRGKK